jgi:opacity protein-like surface antigen
MKASLSVVILILMTAGPVLAQQDQQVPQDQTTRGYITGVAGFSFFSNISGFGTAGDQSTSHLGVDLGFHLKRHLLVFGEGAWLRNLQKGIQPMLFNTTTSIYANHTIGLTGTGTLPVWYGLGGLGIAGPTWGQWTPYALGGVGVARLDPTLHFTYNSGTIPGQTTAPAAGSDVTAALTSAGYFKAPLSSTARTFTAGGGIQLAFARHWIADGAYRYLQIGADSALASKAFSTNTLAVGLGARF